MRVKGKKLDPTDSYESDWFGGAEKSEGTRLGCDGNAVAGIFGRAGNVINAIGLIQRVPGQGRPQPRGTGVTIVYAQWGRNQTWANVTARVQELVDAGGEFVLNTETLKSDPTPGNGKHLKIVYRKNQKETTLWFDEKAKVDAGKFD